MDAEKAKELKHYARELLKDHEKLSSDLAAAEALAAERQAAVERLTAEAARARGPEGDAPNNFLFGELCRVREKAHESEVAARVLERRLSMAEDLRAVDVARARAASSRALAEALAALRRRAARRYGGDDGAAEVTGDLDAAEAASARAWDEKAEDWSHERRSRLAALEAACDACRRAYRDEAYRNGDGVAAVEGCLEHRAASGVDDCYATFLLEAGAAAAVAAAARGADARAREHRDAAMRAVARARDARLGRWAQRIGWGRGRFALLELLNRGALSAGLRALTVEEEPQLKSAEHAVAHYRAGALLADPRCAKRACLALAQLETAGVAFQLRHASLALERLRGDAAATSPPGSPSAPAAVASAPRTPPRDDAHTDADDDSDASGPSRVADLDARSVRSARTRSARTTIRSVHRATSDAPEDPWPPPVALAALRRAGARSAGCVALADAPWRRCAVEPPGLGRWLSASPRDDAAGATVRVRLRDGADEHVVVWQWQSRSRRLSWTLEVADEPANDGDRSSASTSEGGAEATANVASTPAGRGARVGRAAVPAAPEVWTAPDHIAGADRDLGAVHESWAVVPAGADVVLACRIAPQRRPLVRARSARFRVVAWDARRFYDAALAGAARSADAAAWRVAEERTRPPEDAASHAATRQLVCARAFSDLERAVSRVFFTAGIGEGGESSLPARNASYFVF